MEVLSYMNNQRTKKRGVKIEKSTAREEIDEVESRCRAFQKRTCGETPSVSPETICLCMIRIDNCNLRLAHLK